MHDLVHMGIGTIAQSLDTSQKWDYVQNYINEKYYYSTQKKNHDVWMKEFFNYILCKVDNLIGPELRSDSYLWCDLFDAV